MDLQSTTVKGFELYGDLLHIFSDAGVDVYQLPWLDKRIAWAALQNVTCGTVNDVGIYLGTSDSGVWLMPHGRSGASVGSLVNVLSDSTTLAIGGTNIAGLAGFGTALLICHEAGADFLPDPLTRYSYADASGCGAAAIDGTRIAYAVASGLHYDSHPAADWTSGDVTVLTDASSPAIVGNTVQDLRFGADLFVATSGGVSIYDGSGVTDIASPTHADVHSVSTSVGTPSGSVVDLRSQDASYYHVDEDNGAPAFFVSGSFQGITTSLNGSLHIYGRYQGNIAHNVDVRARSKTSGLMVTLGQIAHATVDADHAFALTSDYLQDDGTVDWEIEHTSAGNTSHDLYLDHVYVDVAAETVNDTRALWPAAGATRTTGEVALATSNDAGGGRCSIYDLALANTLRAEAGDTSAIWLHDELESIICDADLLALYSVAAISPGREAREVRTDWQLYLEAVDDIGGLASVTLKIDGTTVSPTTTAITEGFKVVYAPPAASANAKRHSVELIATANDGHSFTRSWSFTTATASTTDGSDTAPPDVVCTRDVSLAADEGDEVVGGVNVIWADELRSPLIVTVDQAEAAGRVIIDGSTYHRHTLSLTVLRQDSDGDDTLDIQQGDILTVDVDALGLTAKKVEVLAKQRRVDKRANDNPTTALLVAHYELVTP